LGDLLIDANTLTEEQLQDALAKQKGTGKRLGDMLIELKYTTEMEIAEAIAGQLNMDMVNLAEAKIEEDILRLVNEPVLRKYSAIPLEYDSQNPNILRLAMSDPLNIIAVDDISIITNLQIEPVVATPSDINDAIERLYGSEEAMKMAETYAKERAEQFGGKEKQEDDTDDSVNSAPIVQLTTKIIEQAVRERASDIHIEALERQVRVRFRVDGMMKESMKYDLDLLPAITARLKIIGGMDISEKRIPQDGRISMMVDRKEYDIRISVLPTVHGEKSVMRIASKTGLNRGKKELGFGQDDMQKFDTILKNSHGIILVTGPTGSGKSTTLYTVLNELNDSGVNIITVEDPVEANVEGINQVHVNDKAGLSFASALRSILRQDPDIIMIGEIRDNETAGIAVKAAVTGHLVVSTLHTNSAAATVTRLIDMGLESYLIADSVVGIIAQRLVRRLCPKCKVGRYMTDVDKKMMNLSGESNPVIYDPKPDGCPACGNTGYKGRIGIYEIMTVSPKLKTVIAKNGSADDIQAIALGEGMHTLRISSAKLVLKGVTSMAEMERVAFE
jgi:type IV pilus assembly protein PilB